MARDTEAVEDAKSPKARRASPADARRGEAAASKSAGAGRGPVGAPPHRRLTRAIGRVFSAWGRRSARFLDFLSADARRRGRTAFALAVAVNTLLFTALAVFGRFQIWIPNAPGDMISVVMVELPPAPEPPETPEPEIVPEPEPEPEPEIAEPEPEPELAEQPEPEPEPAPAPAPAPTPEPALDLVSEPAFAPPSEEEVAPLIPETEEVRDLSGPEPIGQEAPPVTPEEALQTPAEEAPPLVDEIAEPEPEPPGPDQEEEAVGEAPAPEAPESPPPSGDDMFDEEPVFGARAPLPAVDLPEGEAAIQPGSSGVVAIFCKEQFTNDDKVAECAGRTEIRSGWRPGASGEDWSEASRLLKQDRATGQPGADPSLIYGAAAGRQLQDRQTGDDLRDFRRSVDGVNDPAGAASGNLTDTLGQPPIGPEPFEPSWTLREDPLVDQSDLKKLEKELEEAEKNK